MCIRSQNLVFRLDGTPTVRVQTAKNPCSRSKFPGFHPVGSDVLHANPRLLNVCVSYTPSSSRIGACICGRDCPKKQTWTSVPESIFRNTLLHPGHHWHRHRIPGNTEDNTPPGMNFRADFLENKYGGGRAGAHDESNGSGKILSRRSIDASLRACTLPTRCRKK